MLWKRIFSTALGIGFTLPFAIAGDAILYPKPGVTWVQGYHHNVTWKLDVVLGNLGGTNDTMSAMSGNSTSAATSSTTGAMNSTIITSTITSAAPASTASSGVTTSAPASASDANTTSTNTNLSSTGSSTNVSSLSSANSTVTGSSTSGASNTSSTATSATAQATPSALACMNGMPTGQPMQSTKRGYYVCSRLTLLKNSTQDSTMILAENLNLTAGHAIVEVPSMTAGSDYNVELQVYPNGADIYGLPAANYFSGLFSISEPSIPGQ